MTKIARRLLILEMIIAFTPLCFGWTLLAGSFVNGVLAPLAALSLAAMITGRDHLFALIYNAPLLCALHLLWLGRSYFASE